MIRPANYCQALIALLLLPIFDGNSLAVAQVDLSGSDRTELIYFIGQVTNVAGRSATVNLGECHSLDPIHPITKQIQTVSIFRPEGSTISPVGVVSVRESGAVASQVRADYKTKIRTGDIVVFVRQMDELLNPAAHEDHVLRSLALRKKQVARRSSHERNATAELLAVYGEAYPKWERSRSRVSGYFFTRPDLELTSDLERLLKQVDLFRRYHGDGFLSVKAAGPIWETTMGPLFGQDTTVKHRSAIAAAKDAEDAEQPLNTVKLQQIIEERFFDSTDQGKRTAAFLAATALRVQPRSLDQWLQTQFLQTQFPQWVDNAANIERIRLCVQAMEANN
ncbi:MAG: hypothetical protein ABJZ55_12995 [Fuerstiella sp.]